MVSASSANGTITFEYDFDGLRTSKKVGSVTHNYLYVSGQLLRETYEDIILDFSYDANGYPYALKYNGTTYYYITNLQGDVMYLVDGTGATVASYEYDPYGNIVSATGPMAEINPLRYRGYYYDAELEMYYLQSRYYDPMVGRFINADDVALLGASGTALGYNLFSYCENKPISRIDCGGELFFEIVCVVTLAYLGHNLVHSLYNQSLRTYGYIYNQKKGTASQYWFGPYRSSYNGCGWIATYNAAIMLGKHIAPDKIISEYELTGAVLYGTFGIQPYAISAFFRNRGYKVTTTYDTSKFDSVAKKNTANIVWYWHSSGAHYVAVRWGGSRFIGYNTFSNSSGADNWGKSISKFLSNHNYTGAVLISIS